MRQRGPSRDRTRQPRRPCMQQSAHVDLAAESPACHRGTNPRSAAHAGSRREPALIERDHIARSEAVWNELIGGRESKRDQCVAHPRLDRQRRHTIATISQKICAGGGNRTHTARRPGDFRYPSLCECRGNRQVSSAFRLSSSHRIGPETSTVCCGTDASRWSHPFQQDCVRAKRRCG